MNKILPFVRLDLYTIKPYKKSFLLLLVLSVVMTISFYSLATLCSYLMMCLILTMTYPFSIGETNKLDSLYATLSIKRRNVVMGRYVFSLCMEVFAISLALILSWGFSAFTAIEFILPEILFSLCIASFIFTVILSFQYPIYFKLGYNKAKFIAYVPLLIVCFGLIMLQNVLKSSNIIQINLNDFLQFIETYKYAVCAVPVIVGHLLLCLSCALSCRLYEKREI